MQHQRTFCDIDPAKLDLLAQQLATQFPMRMAVGLVGTLGAGKTTLVQRIAASLGIDPADVTSPTFTLMQSYQSADPPSHQTLPPVLNHLDAYRLADEDEFWELGVDELFEQPGWTLVEWADRMQSVMPDSTLWIRIRLADGDLREIELSSNDPAIAKAIDGLDLQ